MSLHVVIILRSSHVGGRETIGGIDTAIVFVLAITLGSNIGPAVGLLDVLLVVRFTLGSIWASLEVALIQGWGSRVLVVMLRRLAAA